MLNGLSAKHLDSTTAFDIRGGPGGAIALLYTIDDGLRAEELRQKRLKQGVLEEDDLKPAKLVNFGNCRRRNLLNFRVNVQRYYIP